MKRVVPAGEGEAPRAKPSSAADPSSRHRCAECGKLCRGTSRAFHGRETDRFVCFACLELAGQVFIDFGLLGDSNMSEIKVGDTIRHKAMGSDPTYDVTVLAIHSCDPADHPAFDIKDPETGDDDSVCSRDFVKVG